MSFFSFKSSKTDKSLADPTDSGKEYWKGVWPSVQEAASQSEEHIDKKVFALSAGAIGLELTLLEIVGKKELVGGCGERLAFIAAGLFITALLLNLFVHLIGRGFQSKQSRLIKDYLHDSPKALPSHQIYNIMEKHSKWILRINWCSAILAVAGVVCLFVYSFLKLSLLGN